MNPIEIQKEIQKLGGIRTLYKSTKDAESLFGKKKFRMITHAVETALYRSKDDDLYYKELCDRLNNIQLDGKIDTNEYFRLRRKVCDEIAEYKDNNNFLYRLKEDYILLLSKNYYSKSHSTYYSPIILEAYSEVEKILPNNWIDLDNKDEDKIIKVYKDIISILEKYDCIEPRKSNE